MAWCGVSAGDNSVDVYTMIINIIYQNHSNRTVGQVDLYFSYYAYDKIERYGVWFTKANWWGHGSVCTLSNKLTLYVTVWYDSWSWSCHLFYYSSLLNFTSLFLFLSLNNMHYANFKLRWYLKNKCKLDVYTKII